MKLVSFYLFLIISGLLINSNLTAQPSGGPYGPIQQKYELPKIAGTIYYVSPDGKAVADGKTLNTPTLIEAAIEQVKTGDAIILRGGTYRTGNLVFNQGITIQPYADELPVFKGTFVATDWQNLRNGLWRTPWEKLFPMAPQSWWRKETEGKLTPLHKFNNDMVFVNGKFLNSAGWLGEVKEDSYYIDYDAKMVYIGTNPENKLVEITAFNAAMIRTIKEIHGKKSDKIGPVIKGITFTQYAYRALEVEGYTPEGIADESKFGKDVVGTTFENCAITFCSRVAAYLYGDKLTMRNCKISDTSTEGIYIMSSSDVLLEKNIFTRNNIEQITGYYPAAVKIFNQTHRVTCNDNLILDLPFSNGIWYDVGNVDGVFTNNWLENVGFVTDQFSRNSVWPSQNAFFFEISKGATVAGNVFVNCDHGMLILNSDSVMVYNNTFVNSMACFGRDQRSAQGDHFGWHPSTGPDVEQRVGHEFVNNLMFGDENYTRPLLFIWQPEMMCERLKEPALAKLNNNVYVNEGETRPIIWLSQELNGKCQIPFNTSAELHQIKADYESKSMSFTNYKGPLFKGSHLGNYQLLPIFSKIKIATELPDPLKKLLSISKEAPYFGAYPLVVQK
jgi:parallel beta-helix repeat protein